MRAWSKLLVVAAALLLAFGAAACGGGDDDSGSATTETSSQADSVGDSAQSRAEGGDNSVQEFGEEADSAEFEAAAAVLHDFLDARAAEDWESACSVLAEEVRQMLKKVATRAAKQLDDTSCVGIMAALTNPAAERLMREEARAVDIASLRIEDDRGYLVYRNSKGTVLAIPMISEGGEWKISGVAGSPIS